MSAGSSSSEDVLETDDMFPEILSSLSEFVIPFLKQPPGRDLPQRLIGPSPFTFYDQHLDERLILKRTALLPSLSSDLANVVDQRLAELRQQGFGSHPVFSTRGNDLSFIEYPNLVLDYTAERVAGRYASTIGHGCLPIVSNWIVHPHLPKYLSTLEFSQRRGPRLEAEGVQDRLAIRFKLPEKQRAEIMSGLDGYTQRMLLDLSGKSLAVWVFLPLAQQSEDILRGMDDLSVVESPICATRGLEAVAQPLQSGLVDAKSPPWTLPPGTSSRGEEEGRAETQTGGPIWIPSDRSASKFRKMRTTTSIGLAHHAWQVAAEDDATIIVINCGNYERIGIRHRATQALYLSEVYPCFRRAEEPAFGKIQFGLQLATISDAVDRYQQQHPRALFHQTVPVLGKRQGDQLEPQNYRRSKRLKTNAYVQTVVKSIPQSGHDPSMFWTELAKRPITLVRLQYGPFNSPSPALCRRKGDVLPPHIPSTSAHSPNASTRTPKRKKSYLPSECATLTLNPPFSYGATGRIHPGQLEVLLSTGHKLTHDVIVKVVMEPKARKRAEREYGIYKHLWSHKVQRIPAIYGLLEDVDNLATLMVMEKGGSSFRDREPYENNGGLLNAVTTKERSTCVQILRDIHRAGVLHRDLRAENIVIARDGLPMIIDFDRARTEAPVPAQRREMKYLQEILDGQRVTVPLSSSPESLVTT